MTRKEQTMKKYYVEYVGQDGKKSRTEYFREFEEAYEKYIELLELAHGTCWAKDAYKNTKIITVYC